MDISFLPGVQFDYTTNRKDLFLDICAFVLKLLLILLSIIGFIISQNLIPLLVILVMGFPFFFTWNQLRVDWHDYAQGKKAKTCDCSTSDRLRLVKRSLVPIVFILLGVILGSTIIQTNKRVVDRTVDTAIVYITSTGECYHAKTCGYLEHSSKAVSISEAKSRGYRPCLVCGGRSDTTKLYKTETKTHPIAGGIVGGLIGVIVEIALYFVPQKSRSKSGN